ncbi:MAG TPA: secretin N-terminal domain-containing protein [Verrucomicrobiae bacterium]|jgi:type II secretory pathway component GspD/PulD (secretin)
MTTRSIIAIATALLTTAGAAFAQDDAASAKPPAADSAKEAPATADTSMAAEPMPTNGIVLNFHEVPLNTVLNYLSAKAGLIIVSDANMQGNVSVVAKQPIGTNDIVTLLDEELAKNSLGAVLEGRTLQIMDLDRIKSLHSTPVEVATNLAAVKQSDEIVTEILPIVTLNPVQLVKDLDTLIPKGATVTANEAGSAIIMTASRRDVHRIAEIIGDLDSSSVSEVSVFVLKYADAKSVAAELKEVFQSADSDVTRATTRNNFAGGRGGRGGGFNPFGGGFGGGGGGGGNNNEESKNSQTHAVFVSDDQMNAVVASAPPSYMLSITNVIAQLDQPSQDVTVIRVFPLTNADPTEIASELGDLFPNSTSSDQNNRNMGFRFAPPWMRGGGGSDNKSTRMKAQTSVIAVADRRTESVIVTASKDLMPEIKGMIDQLDQGRAGKTHVSAFALDAADPASVQLTLTGLFMNTGSSSSTTSTTALSARGTANNNAQSSTSSMTTSGFGGSGGIGTSALH